MGALDPLASKASIVTACPKLPEPSGDCAAWAATAGGIDLGASAAGGIASGGPTGPGVVIDIASAGWSAYQAYKECQGGGADGGGDGGYYGLRSKGEAREALRKLNPTDEQYAAANKAIGRTTTKETIDVFRDGANIVVRATRPGHDGYQVVEHTIAPDGSKKVVQYAYDSGGSMVHEDPKT